MQSALSLLMENVASVSQQRADLARATKSPDHEATSEEKNAHLPISSRVLAFGDDVSSYGNRASLGLQNDAFAFIR